MKTQMKNLTAALLVAMLLLSSMFAVNIFTAHATETIYTGKYLLGLLLCGVIEEFFVYSVI